MTKVRVLVPITSTDVRKPDDMQKIKLPGVEISAAYITAGPPSIESRVDEAFCVPGLIALALQAEKEGIDALVIDCMGDPGVGTLREAVGIPVLGVAQTAMSMASNLARSFGVVTTLDRTITLIDELVDVYGYERHYVGCRSISTPVLEIHRDIDKVKVSLADTALALAREKNAAAIILGCTGFFGCAEVMRARLHEAGYVIPVIDPMPTAVAVAAAMVNSNLSHSRVSFPAYDKKKPIVGFDHILPKN